MKPLIVPLRGGEKIGQALARKINGELVEMELRQFPDGESYVRIDSPVAGRDVIVIANLDEPNTKLLPLIYVAESLHDLKAASVGLVAPYLAYLRQDTRFRPGEGLTSRYFAQLISRSFDWLVTVEPHLHRYTSLDEVYSIPSLVVQTAEPIAEWIKKEVENPLLVGPDEESRQWVTAVADAGSFPALILEKSRLGDYDVEVTSAGAPVWSSQQPVIIDDIISTGRTMLEAARHIRQFDLQPAICVGVHSLFVADAYECLKEDGVTKVVTCNTIAHASNAIDITDVLVEGTVAMLAQETGYRG